MGERRRVCVVSESERMREREKGGGREGGYLVEVSWDGCQLALTWASPAR